MAAGGDDEAAEERRLIRRREMGVACDHCNQETAILYCRADSAKLCVACDQHVHSANPLSLKHIRSQICDNCASQPVAVHCVSDNLMLCIECDSDAHSSVTNHRRESVQGFSGCPAPAQLAAHLGHDLMKLVHCDVNIGVIKGFQCDDEEGGDDQFMVPSSSLFGQVYRKGRGESSSAGLIGGNQKHAVLKQLVHLFHTQQQQQQQQQDGDEHFQIRQQEEDAQERRRGFMDSVDGDDDKDAHSLLLAQSLTPQQQLLPFTSLLMQQQVSTSTSTGQLDVMNEVDQGGFEQGESGQMLWNTHPSDQGTQVFSPSFVFNRFLFVCFFLLPYVCFLLVRHFTAFDYLLGLNMMHTCTSLETIEILHTNLLLHNLMVLLLLKSWACINQLSSFTK